MLKKFVDVKARIWGSESHACSIVYDVSTKRFYAETEYDIKRLTEENYEKVLNDLFMDYCIKNANYMGVS